MREHTNPQGHLVQHHVLNLSTHLLVSQTIDWWLGTPKRKNSGLTYALHIAHMQISVLITLVPN